MSVEALYQEIILDHYRHPRSRGLREEFDAEAHHVNPTCGDEITVRVQLDDIGSGLRDISYVGEGCSISQASASVLTEQLTGLSVEEALQVSRAFQNLLSSRTDAAGADDAPPYGEDVEDVLGDAVAFAGVAKYPARVKCALLAWMAWKDATARAVAQKEIS